MKRGARNPKYSKERDSKIFWGEMSRYEPKGTDRFVFVKIASRAERRRTVIPDGFGKREGRGGKEGALPQRRFRGGSLHSILGNITKFLEEGDGKPLLPDTTGIRTKKMAWYHNSEKREEVN